MIWERPIGIVISRIDFPGKRGEHGLRYVSGLLRIEARSTMAHIGRKTNVAVQNMHRFMSNSPWPGRTLIQTMQGDVKQHHGFQAGGIVCKA